MIDQPQLNVVVLQRTLAPSLRADAERLSRRAGFRLITVVTPSHRGKQELSARLPGFPDVSADISIWAEVLADLTECCAVGVRLASVEHGMCSRLHVDHVALRVVTTYAGAGTHFVENADIDRRFLGHSAEGATQLLRPGALIHAADSGDIVLLKGERWPGNQGAGAVHRSPSASAEHLRLVMTLDPLWN